MDQQHPDPHPLPREVPLPTNEAVSPTAPAASSRRRRLLAVTAASVLLTGAAGVGVGYAGVEAWQRGHTATTPSAAGSTTQPGTSSFQQLPPGYTYGGDQSSGQQQTLPQAPFGDQSQDGSGSTSGSTASEGSSTDTSGTASGSQLTGLVRIVSTMKYSGGVAAGTGMVLTSTGEVVTNHHVVEGATAVKVKVMSTGTTYTATVVGTDASRDVAVLQLADASGLATVTPDTDGVTTGEAVTAVGDGNGTVDHLSAATGSVLARRQAITPQSEGSATGESLSGLIKISSDVVSGYSGGATYDADGEVVGMTTAASSGTSDVVGYAVPVATVLKVADDLENGVADADYAYGRPAFLGIALGNGTTVAGVYAGTPAAKAGLTEGDTITSLAGVAVDTQTQLRAAVASHRPGDQVSVAWTDTGGARHTETLTLQQARSRSRQQLGKDYGRSTGGGRRVERP